MPALQGTGRALQSRSGRIAARLFVRT